MRPAILAALLLAGCAAYDPGTYLNDAEGYALPQNCRAAPESVPVAAVIDLPRSQLAAVTGQRTNAYYHFFSNTVAIADDMTGWRRADTLHHEQFHAYCQKTHDPCCVGHFAPIGG